jgi:glycosidase
VRRCASAALALTLVLGVGAALATAPKPPPPPAGAELAALAKPPTRSAFASQRTYFVMPDRYANGDTANDRAGRSGSRVTTGYDPADTGWYHGGDLKGLTGGCSDPKHGLRRIAELGFTALWVTPVLTQRTVQGSSAAYHGYWGLDFTHVDPHVGTDADFAALVDCAHRLGLKVYLDVVVNHTGDVITLGGSTYSEAPYRDCRGRPFLPARYANGSEFPCLKPETMPRIPYIVQADRGAKRPAWLNDMRRYHNRGDIDFASCTEQCFEQGDFFGLDDLFTEQPVVSRGLAALYAGWISRFKVDGFRVDTAKHVNAAFFKIWTPRLLAAARAAGVKDFEVFGEVFVTDSVDLSRYVRRRGLPNVIDFPLQDALVRYASGSAGANGIRIRLLDDDYFAGPSGRAYTPATFLGNHDIGRAALLIQDQSQATGAELLARVNLAHSLLYLLRGAPVVYYGDEFGIIGRGGDKEARQDLFPTQVIGWKTDPRVGSPPIGNGSSFDVTAHPVGEHLRALGRLRAEHPALSVGATIVRRAQGPVLVVSRVDAAAKREYVAAFNSGDAPGQVTVDTATPSASWTALLGGSSVASTREGRLTLQVAPLTARLFRADVDFPDRAPATVTLRVSSDEISEFWTVSASAARTPESVTFAVRRAGVSRWRRLASDDSPPLRAFLDPADFRRGEVVHLVAVARWRNGSVTTSPVVAFTVRRT